MFVREDADEVIFMYNIQLALDLLEKLLEIDCEKRVTANQAKKHKFFESIQNSIN